MVWERRRSVQKLRVEAASVVNYSTSDAFKRDAPIPRASQSKGQNEGLAGIESVKHIMGSEMGMLAAEPQVQTVCERSEIIMALRVIICYHTYQFARVQMVS